MIFDLSKPILLALSNPLLYSLFLCTTLCPTNSPVFSIMSSLAVILPSILPCGRISTILHSQSPINFPLTTKCSELILPLTLPFLPMATFVLAIILPSKVPSICKLHSLITSPFIFVPCAMMLVFPEFPLICLSLLAKIAILYFSPFQKFAYNPA